MSGDELCFEEMNRYGIRIVRDNMGYFNLQITQSVFLDFNSSIDINVSSDIHSIVKLDNERLCIGRVSNEVELINIENCKVKDRVMLSGHTCYVTCLLLLPDGRLGSGSDDKTIKIWNILTRQCAMTLIGHTHGIVSICALSDTRICSGSEDDTIKIWNVHSGVC